MNGYQAAGVEAKQMEHEPRNGSLTTLQTVQCPSIRYQITHRTSLESRPWSFHFVGASDQKATIGGIVYH